MGVWSTIGEARARTLAGPTYAISSGTRPWDILPELGPIGAGRQVVIQGGLSTDAYLYDPMRRMLDERAFVVDATHLDFHGFASLERDATNLARRVEASALRSIEAGGDGLVNVVTHSKGGLAARWYLQRMGGIEHVAQLVTIGTPHRGASFYGPRLTALAAQLPVPGTVALKQLALQSDEVSTLNEGLQAFMESAVQARPSFRIVSVAGNLDLPGLRDTDGVVSNWSSRLDELVPGLDNIVLRGRGAHHGAIAGQLGMFKPTLLAATELLAGRSVPDAAAGARQLTR